LSKPFPRVDRIAARRRFERAAATYARAARLEAEAATRMLERLDYVKIAPRRILDAGSGPAREAKELRRRYRGAEIIALDFSPAMLRRVKGSFLWRPFRVCGDLASIPLAPGSVDLVWSNMALHWVPDPEAVFGELQRVLAVGGLLMFTTLGPDTLKELRRAAGARVHEFVDMHDLGDMLAGAGFADPVMDMELLTFTYEEGAKLLADLRASGKTSARVDRPRGLAAKGLKKILSQIERRASFEIVYGHAWKGAPRKLADVRDIVQFRRPSLR